MPPGKVSIKKIDGHVVPQIQKGQKFFKDLDSAIQIVWRRILGQQPGERRR
jgi:hypothetical protein